MLSAKSLREEVRGVFATKWTRRQGRVVPDIEAIRFANDSVSLDATVLYADLVESTSLVDGFKDWFAAEVYKAFLASSCRVIREHGGEVTAFDGDRVMALFLGEAKNSNAAQAALQINWVMRHVVAPALKEEYPDVSYVPRQVVGIDTSPVLVAKTGIRASNDLVWVGRAPNYAAKLAALREGGYSTLITADVHKHLRDNVKFGGSPKRSMWEVATWHEMDMSIYRSNWTWTVA